MTILIKEAAIIIERHQISRLQAEVAAILFRHNIQGYRGGPFCQTDIDGLTAVDMEFKAFFGHQVEECAQVTG